MRIGVDGGTWNSGRGYGRFTREILRAMIRLAPDDEWVMFLDGEAADRFDGMAANVRVVRVAIQPPGQAASAAGYRSPRDLARMTRAVAANRTDVFFSPSVYSYFPLPPWQRAVVTVHDAIPERFPALTMPTRRARWFWNAKVWLALKQSRLVLTVSEYAAGEVASALGVARARIRVAEEAPAAAYRPSESARDIAEVAARYGLGEGDRWFVYVGGFNPHKRLDALVRAHAAVVRRSEGNAPHLLLVGNAAADTFYKAVEQIRAEIETSGTGPLVHWTGFVSDDDLRHLHSGAVAVVLPSASEGFGLPAVEGAACGTPVIATTASPLPELLKGGGLFVAPGDEDAIADAMERLLGDDVLRQTLGACAGVRARSLSWDAGAMAALGALREAAA